MVELMTLVIDAIEFTNKSSKLSEAEFSFKFGVSRLQKLLNFCPKIIPKMWNIPWHLLHVLDWLIISRFMVYFEDFFSE